MNNSEHIQNLYSKPLCLNIYMNPCSQIKLLGSKSAHKPDALLAHSSPQEFLKLIF